MTSSDILKQVQIYRDSLSREQRLGALAVVLLVLLIIPRFTSDYFLLDSLILVYLFVIQGHGWNILGGYAGQISLGHAVFVAIGAYTTMILQLYYGITPFIGLWVGGLLAAFTGFVLGALTFRLRYHYFAMATLAVAVIFKSFFARWNWIGGTSGLQIPLDKIGTLQTFTFESLEPYYYILGVSAIIVTLFMYKLDQSKLGTYLKAININQELTENAGLHVFWYKMYAISISAFITGISGGYFALYVKYIDPSSTLEIIRNVDPIVVTLIGGSGTVLGPVVGAFIFTFIRNYTRTFLSGNLTGLGWVVFGLLIILISIYRPGGLLNPRYGEWEQEE
jgi:branched-chain amino acid transport system permease protein